MHHFTPALFVPAALFAGVVQAQSPRVPTDVELRAAYCVPVVRSRLQTLTDYEAGIEQMLSAALSRTDLAPEQRAKIEGSRRDYRRLREDEDVNLRRLQAYVMPRVSKVDKSALMIAIKRGEADVQTLAARGTECEKSCLGDATTTCVDRCIGEDLSARLRPCWSITWLPF